MKTRLVSEIHRRTKPHLLGIGPSSLFWTLGLSAALSGTSALAQTAAVPQGPSTRATTAQPYCSVKTSGQLKLSIGDDKALLALCGGSHLVPLGPADTFDVLANQGADAILVDVRTKGTRKILLVSRQENGLPLVENISGQISLRAGKGPMSSIDDIDIDLTSFASDGTINVGGHSKADVPPRAGRIDLKSQVEGTRAAGFSFSKKN